MKEYWCECGQKFDNPQKFNAHKSHCSVHLGEEKYLKRTQHMKKMADIRAREQLENSKIKNRKELENWIAEKHKCECCGKVMTIKYGSGRFCCKSCANTRHWKEEDKNKIRKSVINTLLNKSEEEKVLNDNRRIAGMYDNIYMASSYEIIYYLYCKNNNIKIERCPFRFSYVWNNNEKIYVPDFYLPDSDTIVELKGRGLYYDKEQTELKERSVVNHKYKIIYDEDIIKYSDWLSSFYNIPKQSIPNFVKSLLKTKESNSEKYKSRKHDPRTKNYTWINNKNLHKNTLIPNDKLNEYLNSGWEKGRVKFK